MLTNEDLCNSCHESRHQAYSCVLHLCSCALLLPSSGAARLHLSRCAQACLQRCCCLSSPAPVHCWPVSTCSVSRLPAAVDASGICYWNLKMLVP